MLLTNIALVVALLLQGNAPAQVTEQGLYVYDGHYLVFIHSDPDRVHVDQWAAFYFKKGGSTSLMSERWGMETKKSRAEVMKSVEENQKFEHIYEKWCGCDWGTDTFSNVVAPVAMTKSALEFSIKQHQISDEVHGIWDRVPEILKAFNDASATADVDGLPKSMSGPFAAFMRNMQMALDQGMSINSLIPDSGSALASLETQISEFNKVTADVAETATPAVQLMAGTSTPDRRASTTDSSLSSIAPSLARNKPEPLTAPSSPIKANGNARAVYAVQVGAFGGEAKADAMISQLKQKKYDRAYKESDGRTVYRVRVGPVTDLQAARDLQKNLERDGFHTFVAILKQ